MFFVSVSSSIIIPAPWVAHACMPAPQAQPPKNPYKDKAMDYGRLKKSPYFQQKKDFVQDHDDDDCG